MEAGSETYITFLDSDDCHLPSTLATMLNVYLSFKNLVPEMVLMLADAFLINENVFQKDT